MSDCIFCKIANKEINASFVYEDDNVCAFHDINPVAPVHILVIPKVHVETVNDFNEENAEIIKNLMLAVPKVAEKAGVKEKGYKVVFNVGKGGGQEIFHVHAHIISGLKIKELLKKG